MNNCEIDHLDDNPFNNESYNYVLVHSECNKEKRNSFDYKILAKEKLEENKKKYASSLEITESDDSPETEHNKNVSNLTEQCLSEKINTDGYFEYSDALDGITYLALKKFGHCSQVSVRRHLSTFTSPFAPYMIIRNEKGKKIIVRRTGN